MRESLENLLTDPTAAKLLIIILGLLGIILIVTFLKHLLGRYLRDSDNWYTVRKTMNGASYVLFILFVLFVYSDRLGDIMVMLGVAGAGLAFALQEVIISIAGWIAIVTGRIFRSGDRVQLGGIKGDVIDFGILRTTIMEIQDWVDGDLYNGKIVLVANSFVFREPVFNYSTDFPFVWDELTIPVRFGSDSELARDILNRVADQVVGNYAKLAEQHWERMVRKYLIEDAATRPMVTMVINDNWLEYTLRYVVHFRKRKTTQDALFTEILREVEHSAGKVQFASATFELTGMPNITVRRAYEA
ncbi:MAG: mechanosensitive ion channel [Bacillota bacterium]|nr:mechanosensitive ion channel [Bacillota bacterium]